MKAKTQTRLEKYRAILAEKAAQETIYDVACAECGMVWGTKRIDIQSWITSGMLPVHLAEVMMKAAEAADYNPAKADGAQIMQSLEPIERLHTIEFTNKVVRQTAVEPKIVDLPKGDNEISPDDVLQCCYSTLLEWQTEFAKGGAKGPDLETFRKKR